MSHRSLRRPALLSLIAAVAANGVIGARGGLPWRLPDDLRFFRAQTMGRPVIMGRRTWDSIGKPLPGRTNIVVSRRPGFSAPGAQVADSLDAALAQCADAAEAFVIGGAELYRAALPHADRLVLTEIRREFDGDVVFPEFDRAHWRETGRESHAGADGLAYDFARYERAR